jgi:hypothetical protein
MASGGPRFGEGKPARMRFEQLRHCEFELLLYIGSHDRIEKLRV